MADLVFNRPTQIGRTGNVYRGHSLLEKRPIGQTGQFLRLREAARVSDPAQTAALERRVLSMRGLEVARQGWTPADLGPTAQLNISDYKINVVGLQMIDQVREILSLSSIFDHTAAGFDAQDYRNGNGFVTGISDPETQERIADNLKELTKMDVRLLYPSEARQFLTDPDLSGFRDELVEDGVTSLYSLINQNENETFQYRLHGFIGGGVFNFKGKPIILMPEKLGLFLGIPA